MRYFVSVLVALAWALWFGGLITLFLVVTQLSQTFPAPRRNIFGEAGSATFIMFERYQLIIGAIALIAAFALRLMNPSAIGTALFTLLALAAVGGLVSPLVVTPKIEALRRAGETESPEFRKLHGRSMMIYSSDALILLAAGALMPAAMRRPTEPRG